MKNTNTYYPYKNTSAAELHASSVIGILKVCFLTLIIIAIMFLKSRAGDSAYISDKNTVYIQVAGLGNFHSINFERIFRQGQQLNYSYSIGYSPSKTTTSVPISVNAFTTGKQHHFEMGVAFIPCVEKHRLSKTTDTDKQLFIKPNIGYRYQKTTNGLFVKIGAGPQIFLDPPSYNVWAFTPKLMAPSAQIAAGISF